MKTIKILLLVIVGLPIGLIALYIGIIGVMMILYPAPDCTNTNPIIENHSYDSNEYKTELIRLLKDSEEEKTKFWFSGYVDSDHILVTIQNDKICAKGHVTVKKWEGFMKHLKEVE